jgi:predicted nucleic acid-binding Zn ribbon protein
MNHCAICGKPILNDDERFGPDCAARYREALDIVETSEQEVGALFLTGNQMIQAWLKRLSTSVIHSLRNRGAQRMKDLSFARYAIEQARRVAGAEAFELENAA